VRLAGTRARAAEAPRNESAMVLLEKNRKTGPPQKHNHTHMAEEDSCVAVREALEAQTARNTAFKKFSE
jgi:hypothetical protein